MLDNLFMEALVSSKRNQNFVENTMDKRMIQIVPNNFAVFMTFWKSEDDRRNWANENYFIEFIWERVLLKIWKVNRPKDSRRA